MSECDKAKIVGYVPQTEAQIVLINMLKQSEIDLINLIEAIKTDCASNNQPLDPRWISIAKTHFQEGFMAAVRAVARPNGD